MTDTRTIAIKKSMAEPDEVLELTKGRVHLVTLGDVTFDRAVFEPGWRRSEHAKPTAKTDSCEFPHRFFVTEGSIHVSMDDGTSSKRFRATRS